VKSEEGIATAVGLKEGAAMHSIARRRPPHFVAGGLVEDDADFFKRISQPSKTHLVEAGRIFSMRTMD